MLAHMRGDACVQHAQLRVELLERNEVGEPDHRRAASRPCPNSTASQLSREKKPSLK